MKTIGKYEINFPETAEEGRVWIPTVRRRPLAPKVLVVAKTRIEGAWCAYVDAVPGQDHDAEEAEVLRAGTKLDELTALCLFHQFEGVPYAL